MNRKIFVNRVIRLGILMILFFAILMTNSNFRVEAEEVFEDDFNDENSGWQVGQIGKFTSEYRHGKYIIKVNKTGTIYRISAPVENIGKEYTVKVDIDSVEKINGAGITFNYLSHDNFYLFLINPKYNVYSVLQLKDNNWRTLIEWTRSKDIKKKDNTLKLVMLNEKARLYVNNKYLETITVDDILENTKIGLAVYAGNTAPAEVNFDDFYLKYTVKKEVKDSINRSDILDNEQPQVAGVFNGNSYVFNYPLKYNLLTAKEYGFGDIPGYIFLEPENKEIIPLFLLEFSVGSYASLNSIGDFKSYMNSHLFFEDAEITKKYKDEFVDKRAAYKYIIKNIFGEKNTKSIFYFIYKDEKTILGIGNVVQEDNFEQYEGILDEILESLDFKKSIRKITQ